MIPLFTAGHPANSVIACCWALHDSWAPARPDVHLKIPRHLLGTIVSMYIGNAMLLVLNLPLIPLWVKVLKIPYAILFPLILIFFLPDRRL